MVKIKNILIDMKTFIKIMGMALGVLALTTACHSGDNEFDDFDYTTVYFANQYPLRTVELGEDLEVDLTNDNQHIVSINAATGGSYSNNNDIYLDYTIDPTLCSGLSFSDGTAIQVMPTSYYNLVSESMVIPSGKIQGGLKVQLTDAFFADAKSLSCNYVIPVKLNSVKGADSILSDKNFVLYAIKYVNPWQGIYLRRGVDKITTASGTTTNVRHATYVENDELQTVTTGALNKALMVIAVKDAAGKDHNCTLILTFNDNGVCSVSTETDGFEVSGTGSFVIKGEKESMGGIDRNALYLNYTVKSQTLATTVATTDTMVVRNRGIKPEYFTVK